MARVRDRGRHVDPRRPLFSGTRVGRAAGGVDVTRIVDQRLLPDDECNRRSMSALIVNRLLAGPLNHIIVAEQWLSDRPAGDERQHEHERARDAGCPRVYWQTHETHTRAMAL